MKNKYTTLLFDLDGTLLNFLRDEHDALLKLMKAYGITCSEENVAIYSRINLGLWKEFEKGEITKDTLQDTRFQRFFEFLGVEGTFDFKEINRHYLSFLSEGGNLIKGARDLLITLKQEGYTLCAVTNGITSAQNKRLKKAGIYDMFSEIFISESIGHQKPKKEFFDYVFDMLDEKDKNKIIIIGDSLSSDIKGAMNAGIDSLWYNPVGDTCPKDITPTYTVADFEEMMRRIN